MTQSRVFAALVLLLLASPALAQKVYVDHDKDYDFSKVKTFAWSNSPETSLEKTDPLFHSRIVNGIEHYISMAGVQEVQSDPDVYVTYHTSSKENLSLNTTNWGYGYPGGWAWGGYWGHGYGYGAGVGSSTTTVSTYQTGTLIVDLWDAKTKNLVWRGTATNITISSSPDKMAKRLDKALAKIVDKSKRVMAKEKKS